MYTDEDLCIQFSSDIRFCFNEKLSVENVQRFAKWMDFPFKCIKSDFNSGAFTKAQNF